MKKNNNKNFFTKKKIIPYNYIWTKEKPMSFITESYQKFLANLEYINVDNNHKVFQITSSLSGEGKTTFTSNIAFLLSQKNKKVIIIDLDLRRPKIHRIYDVDNLNGVTDVLTDRVTLKDAIKRKKKLGFDVLTSGEKTSTITSLLESNKIKDLFKNLREMYDIILVDSPPVINVSDAIYISKLSDALVFIVAQNQTKQGVVKESINQLKQNNVNIAGVVMTKFDLKLNSYSYSYGYSYSYNEDDNWYSYTFDSTRWWWF